MWASGSANEGQMKWMYARNVEVIGQIQDYDALRLEGGSTKEFDG